MNDEKSCKLAEVMKHVNELFIQFSTCSFVFDNKINQPSTTATSIFSLILPILLIRRMKLIREVTSTSHKLLKHLKSHR